MALSSSIGAIFIFTRIQSLKRTFKLVGLPIAYLMIGLFGLLMIGSIHTAFRKRIDDPATSSSATTSVPQPHPWQETKSITVHGRAIQLGMTSDVAFAILPTNDEIGSPTIVSDPNEPDSQIVTHHYQIDSEQISVEFKRRESNGSYVVSKIMQSGATNLSSARAFDKTIQNLGFNFQGDDIAAIANELKTAQSKDEFESSAQYQERLASFRTKPISGTATIDGELVFVQQDLHDGDLASWEGADVFSVYNADKQQLEVRPSLGLGEVGPIIGKNGPGLQIIYHFSDPKKFSVPMTPEKAKDSKSQLNVLFVCKLAQPWIVPGGAAYRDTSGRQASVDLLNVKSVQVWVFNVITGEVVQKQTLTPLRKSR